MGGSERDGKGRRCFQIDSGYRDGGGAFGTLQALLPALQLLTTDRAHVLLRPFPLSFLLLHFPLPAFLFYLLFLPLPPSPALLLVSEFLDFSSRTDSFCGSKKDRYGDRHESKTGIRNDKRKRHKHVNRRTQRNMKGRTWIASLREHLTI